MVYNPDACATAADNALAAAERAIEEQRRNILRKNIRLCRSEDIDYIFSLAEEYDFRGRRSILKEVLATRDIIKMLAYRKYRAIHRQQERQRKVDIKEQRKRMLKTFSENIFEDFKKQSKLFGMLQESKDEG